MKFEEYINSLRKCRPEKSYIELDKAKEIAYMEAHKYRFKEIINSIPFSSSLIRVLDIGTTPFTIFIKMSYPHFEVSTLDLTNLMEDRCEASCIQFKICDLSKQLVPFNDGYFDIVIFTEVLEHLFASPTQVLKEIRRVMCDGGKLIFSVPNFAELINRIRLLCGINPYRPPDEQIKSGWVHGYGHLREYTMKEVASILKACDLTISKKKFLQPSAMDTFKKIRKMGFFALVKGVYYLICALIPSFRTTIYIECYKPSGK